MTWVTESAWMCDGCGEPHHVDHFGRPPEKRRRNRHHKRHPSIPVVGTKFVHYCGEECAEEGDAREVRESLGPAWCDVCFNSTEYCLPQDCDRVQALALAARP